MKLIGQHIPLDPKFTTAKYLHCVCYSKAWPHVVSSVLGMQLCEVFASCSFSVHGPSPSAYLSFMHTVICAYACVFSLRFNTRNLYRVA